MENALLLKLGEMFLRKANRSAFEYRIIKCIRRNLEGLGQFYVEKEQGRLLVKQLDGKMDFNLVIPKVKQVMGLAEICPCLYADNKNLDWIQEQALAMMQQHYSGKTISYKVETKRADKQYPFNSYEISAAVGGYILMNIPNLRVDVHNPEATLNIEIRNKTYLYTKSIKALGGLPEGTSGKGLLLLSGGIDSPVAFFLMAKRGVKTDCIYFHSPPYTSERAKEKVKELAGKLSGYTGGITLHIAPFTDLQMYLVENVPEEKLTIFFKRAMLKVAEQIAAREDAQCLITGDSIGQVASQTLHALQSIDSAVKMAVIRPLAGMDKQEIIDIATTIGTYETSIKPYADCCTAFVPKHPELRPKVHIIEKMESRLPALDTLIAESAANTEKFEC